MMNIRFGDYQLDRGRGLVTGPDGPVNLRPQTFRLLTVLLEHAPDLVDRETVIDLAWGHEYLSANVLPQAISELRQALGDSAQSPRYIQTVHRRGYRMVCHVERQNVPPSSAQPMTPEDPKGSLWWRKTSVHGLAATSVGLVFVAVIALGIHFRDHEPPPPSTEASIQVGQARAIVALGAFPAQADVPEWLPPAALELLTRFLASDERVLVLRGESLGLDDLPPGARWQHAMRDLLSAPLAITGYWRRNAADELLLDYNLIELDSGRQFHGGQLPGSIETLDKLLATAADDLRAALDLPAISVSGGWHDIEPQQRRAYWQALADLNQGHYSRAAEQLTVLAAELNHPGWLAPVLARALRLSGRHSEARKVLAAAVDTPDILRGLGASLRLRAELARLDHDPTSAAAVLRALGALFPDEGNLLLELATAELDDLDGASARRTIERLQTHPLLQRDPRLKLLSSRLAQLDGKGEQARTLAESALADAEHHQLPGLAVEAVIALAGIHQSRGELSQASRQLEDFQHRWSTRLTREQRLSLYLKHAAALRMRGQFDAAEQVLAGAENEASSEPEVLRTAVERALIESEKGKFAQAEAALAAIEDRIRDHADPGLEVAFFSARGRIAAEQGHAEAARLDFAEAFVSARRSGQSHQVAGLQVNAGLMLARQRRFEEADKLWEEALEVFEQIGDKRGEALALSNLAASAGARGLEQRGTELNYRALELFRELDMNSHIARTSFNLGLLAGRQGRFSDADRLFKEAMSHYQDAGSITLAVAAGTRRADTLVALGHFDEAHQQLDQLADYLPQATPLHQADWHASRVRLNKWTGNAEAAAQALRAASELRLASGSPEWIAAGELQRLELDLLTGSSPDEILHQAERQLREISAMNQPRLRAQALALVAESLLMQQRKHEARIQLREARAALSGMPDVLVDIRLDWLEAWTAEGPDRRQRLEQLAARVRSMELDSRLLQVELALDPDQSRQADRRPVLVPAYAVKQHDSAY
jgi:DNA-binding winged helix-turn-helix (wHTH) protein/tetratricopeptide (TPR) repeat protein